MKNLEPFPPLVEIPFSGFSIEAKIGKGASSEIFAVKEEKSNKLFCMKVLHKANADSDDQNNQNEVLNHVNNDIKKLVTREVDALQKLDHPNIIRLYDYFDQDDLIFLVLEYCPNGSLDSYIKEEGKIPLQDTRAKHYGSVKFPSLYADNCGDNNENSSPSRFINSIADKFRIAIDIMKGVEYCHQNNFAHRDIKTANILFDVCSSRNI